MACSVSRFGGLVAMSIVWMGLALNHCDDDNMCTFDWMDEEKGCQHDEVTCGPCHAHQTTPIVDFVFLVDISHPANRTSLDMCYEALRTFREMISADPSVINYRFLLAAFGTNIEIPVIVQHFTRSVKFPRPDVVLYPDDASDVVVNGGNMHESDVAGHLLASLDALNRTISNSTFSVHQGYTASRQREMETMLLTNEHLIFRENADIHVVVVSDLQQTNAMQTNLQDDFSERSLPVIEDIVNSVDRQAVSIGVFLDGANKAAKCLWGDPSLANVYSDTRGFNKAFTLKALIRAGKKQASSVQAHVLSRGVELRMFDINQLRDSDCIRHMYAGYVKSVRTQPEFCNKCKRTVRPCDHKVGCQVEKVECPDKHFCSPTHGCVKKPKKSDREKPQFVSNLESFEFINTSAQNKVNNSRTETCVIQGHVPVLEWQPDRPFARQLISEGRPVVLRNAVPHKWAAKEKWDMAYLSEKLGDILTNVKHTTNDERLTYDPDRRVPMANFSTIPFQLPYMVKNMTNSEFFQFVKNGTEGGCYYFTDMIDALKPDVTPHNLLFVTQEDLQRFKQFLWVSSPGMVTHTHFDQDYNFFVQIYGEKEFTLWLPPEHVHMHMFPRVHPMWHKSRVNFNRPDLEQFPHFRKARAYKARLQPGDILYVPPYTWHHVVSTTQSISLSTYSHDYSVYDHMNSVYRHDHKFDLLGNRTGQMYALRLYLDLMVHELVGNHQTTSYFALLLETRYSGLEILFPVSLSDKWICKSRMKNKIPTAQHVVGYAKLDMQMMAPHFAALRPEVRDILFADYVEEISAQVVGAEKLLAFFRYCFNGQGYYVTDMDDDEHSLWDHKEDEPSIT